MLDEIKRGADEILVFSDNLFAKTQPADPAPTIT